eukprot:gnl/MRDRNA2_/MRDRNA2_92896_c0_seq1.p1 gnl/MRDRNA2_/MRDRNA2_92896_c0~~gnl/MRDRNA2_/MRDRNA2_92896_c0_seq1.p1  ORF type:complete len:851 (-),score=298.48 gnl/MRDRNA2_/MRDRNA2_92896_c0_seq1:201-2516(-)
MTASVIEIFKEGREKEALQTAVEFSTKAFQLYGKTHPTYINALATVAALVDRMGGEGEADNLLQQAEELQDEMEIEQAEQMLEEEFEEELANAVAEAEAADEEETSSGPEDGSSADEEDDEFGYDDYDGEESFDGEEGEEELFGDDEPLNEAEQEEEEAEIITQLTWEVNSLIQMKQPEEAAKILSECEKSLVESGPVSAVGQAALHTLWAAVLDEVGESDKAKELYHQALNCLEEEVGIAPQDEDAGEQQEDRSSDSEESVAGSKSQDQDLEDERKPASNDQGTMNGGAGKPFFATETPNDDSSTAAPGKNLDLEQLHRQQLAAAADVEVVDDKPALQPQQVAKETSACSGGYASLSTAQTPVVAASEALAPELPISPSSPSRPRPAGKSRPQGRGVKTGGAPDVVSGAADTEKGTAKPSAATHAGSKQASQSSTASGSKEAPEPGKASGSKEESTVEEVAEKEKASKRTGGGFGVSYKAPPPKKPKAKAKGGAGKATKEVKESLAEPAAEVESKPEEPTTEEPKPDEPAAPLVVAKTEPATEEITPEIEEAQIKKAMRNADHYIGMRKFEKAADYLEKHLVRLDQGESKHRGSDLHLNLLQQYGSVLRLDGDLDGSLDAFTAADELLEERPEGDLSADIKLSRSQLWMRMAEVCREGEDLSAAEGHLASAINALQGLGDKGVEPLRQAQASLARVYVEMKKYESAETLYFQAFSHLAEPDGAASSSRALRGNNSSDGESSDQEAPKVKKSTMKLKPGQSAGDSGLEAPS